MENDKFQLYVPLTKNTLEDVSYKLNENGTLDIEGIASTTSKDLQGDVMLPSAIESMKKQILAMGKNLHGDHKPFLFDGLLGAVNKVQETDNNKLRIGATILSKYASDVKEMLDIGVNLGFSVGGAMKEYTINKSNGLDIADVYLSEVSLTAMPANLDTLGTVTTAKGVIESTCLGGICHELSKNYFKKMNNEEMFHMSENENPNNTTSQDEELEQKITGIVDRLWGEKEQGLIDTITEKVESEVKGIVQSELDKINSEENSETNETTEENNSSENNSVDKSVSPEQLGKIIAKSVATEMNSFKEQFFKNADENRNPTSHVDLQGQEDLLNQQTNDNLQKTYSTRDTAEILMKKQRSINPVVATALKQL